MPEVAFAKKAVELSKIKNLTEFEISQGLRIVFTRAANLLGIKEAISDINKQDIKEMILVRFKGLSLEEIDYAFKLDRWSGEPVEHFQLFNAEYVSKVLFKYKNWLRETRSANNIPLKIETKKTEISEEEKQIIIINGIIDCFENFKEQEVIPPGKTYVYDYFYQKGLLPVHTKQFREKIKRKAHKWMCENKANLSNDRKTNRQIINEIKSGKNQMQTKCKEIVLKTFFHKLIANKTSIQEVINQPEKSKKNSLKK